jgi:RHS repeat-associated protein
VDDQRRKSVQTINGVATTRYYVGNYEEEILPNGNVRKIHYLSGAVFIQTTGVADSLYYSYSDFQGSLIALVRENGSVIQRFAYDPWGSRRNPDNWTQKDSRTIFIINRGYTGHEHLDAFGIINMNGRVYDPATGMFFSPDLYVQAPGDWLNYNSYGYCMNNPLKYTDPSGYSWITDSLNFLKQMGKLVVIVVASAVTIVVTSLVGLAVGSGIGFVIGGPGGLAVGGSLGLVAGFGVGVCASKYIVGFVSKW